MLGLLALTIALCIAAVVVPRRVVPARDSAIAAGVSPLWLLLPCGAFMALLLSAAPPGEGVALGMLLVQVVLSVWMVFRHRRWPWIALPLAVVLVAWPVLAMIAVALGSMAH